MHNPCNFFPFALRRATAFLRILIFIAHFFVNTLRVFGRGNRRRSSGQEAGLELGGGGGGGGSGSGGGSVQFVSHKPDDASWSRRASPAEQDSKED